MNNTIKDLGNGVLAKTADAKKSSCDFGGYAKGSKEKYWYDAQIEEVSNKKVSLGFDDDYSKHIDGVIDEFKSK